MSGFIKKAEVRKCKDQVISDWGLDVYLSCLVARSTDTFLGILISQGKI